MPISQTRNREGKTIIGANKPITIDKYQTERDGSGSGRGWGI
jgi:hypothetical protein